MSNIHPLDKAKRYNKRRKYLSSPEQKLLESTKTRARTQGLPHNITINDIVIPEFCPVLGYRLVKGGQADESATVDRTDSSKGYVKGNVRIISHRANCLKNNGTLEEFRKIVAYLENE